MMRKEKRLFHDGWSNPLQLDGITYARHIGFDWLRLQEEELNDFINSRMVTRGYFKRKYPSVVGKRKIVVAGVALSYRTNWSYTNICVAPPLEEDACEKAENLLREVQLRLKNCSRFFKILKVKPLTEEEVARTRGRER